MGRGQALEAAVPRQQLLERDVGDVVERPVGVAAVDQGGELAVVDALAVGDPIGADDVGEADVDDLRIDDVHADPEDGQNDRRDREPAHRDHGDQRARTLPRPEPRDQHPHEQIPEDRVDERDRPDDLALVEEELRDREREQDQQVEMQQAEGAPRVEEGQHEEDAERDPDPRLADVAGDGVLVAAGQLDLDLLVAPRLDDGPGPVVDDGLRDVGAVVEVVDLPAIVTPRRDPGPHRRALGPLVADVRRPVGDRDRLGAGELEAGWSAMEVVHPGQRSERLIAERRLQGGVLRGGGTRRRRQEQGEQHRERQDRSQRSHDGHNEAMVGRGHDRAAAARGGRR